MVDIPKSGFDYGVLGLFPLGSPVDYLGKLFNEVRSSINFGGHKG